MRKKIDKSSVDKLATHINELKRNMKKALAEGKGFLYVRLSAEYQKAIRLKENLERSTKDENEDKMPVIKYIIGLDQDLV